MYCKQLNHAVGLAHVVPEAIFANRATLPRGAVCDACNSYFGRDLDGALSRWPSISLFIQFYRLAGKKGVRTKVGPYSLRRKGGSHSLQFCANDPELEVLRTGKRQVTVAAPSDPQFNMQHVRRALHYVAFNTLVAARGVTHALSPQYDPLRRYVRRPKPDEEWPFVAVMIGNDKLRSAVEIHPLASLGKHAIAVQVFRELFVVSLVPDPGFLAAARRRSLDVYDVGYRGVPRASLRYVED